MPPPEPSTPFTMPEPIHPLLMRSVTMAHGLRWPLAVGVGAVYVALAFALWMPVLLSSDWTGHTLDSLRPGASGGAWRRDGYPWVWALFMTLLVALPWVFLTPRRRWVLWLYQQEQPTTPACLVAGMVLGTLTVAGVYTVLGCLGDRFSPRSGLAWWLWPVVWGGAALLVRRLWRGGDRFTQFYGMISLWLAPAVLLWPGALPALGYLARQRDKDGWPVRVLAYAEMLTLATLIAGIAAGVILLFALMPYFRLRMGLCEQCGYDLRGVPGTTCCPECGKTQEVAPRPM